MKVVKKTSEYTVYQRRDERYAVVGADKKPVNGDEKVKILLAEELIKVTAPAAPEPEEAPPEEEPTPAEPVSEPAISENPPPAETGKPTETSTAPLPASEPVTDS